MKRVCSVLGLGLVLSFFFLACDAGKNETPNATAVSSHHSKTLHWSSDWDGALREAKAENKLVIVDFYAGWCIWCKKLEETTLSDRAVMAFLDEHFVPLRLDVDHKGRELSREFRVDGLPTILIVNAQGQEVGRIPGFLPPAAFLKRVQGFVGS